MGSWENMQRPLIIILWEVGPLVRIRLYDYSCIQPNPLTALVFQVIIEGCVKGGYHMWDMYAIKCVGSRDGDILLFTFQTFGSLPLLSLVWRH